MIDIVTWSDGTDLGVSDTDVFRATNILSTQLGSLEYASDLGIDLAYFLNERVKFQDESFKAYLVRVLAIAGINVTDVSEIVHNLFSEYKITLSPVEQNDGLIAG